MTKELEEAFRNIDSLIASVKLTRDEHLILARNIQLLKDTIEAKQEEDRTI